MSASAKYTVTDMGVLPGDTDGQVEGINNRGQIVGESYYMRENNAVFHAWLWQNGHLNRLSIPTGFRESTVSGVNNNGTAVGCVYKGSFAFGQAAAWTQGRPQVLPNINGFRYGTATAINDKGDIVGYCVSNGDIVNARYHPVLWRQNTVQDLGTLGGNYGYARAISRDGQVVGDSDTHINHSNLVGEDYVDGAAPSHAFLWRQGRMKPLVLPNTPIGLPPLKSSAVCINDRGDIAGWIRGWEVLDHACVWHNGVGASLNVFQDNKKYNDQEDLSWASAINNRGQIVGYWHSGEGEGHDHAFFAGNGTGINLDDAISPALGWKLSRATGINDAGEIVGFGRHAGHDRAFLLQR